MLVITIINETIDGVVWSRANVTYKDNPVVGQWYFHPSTSAESIKNFIINDIDPQYLDNGVQVIDNRV
jgi:hypothetical protein